VHVLLACTVYILAITANTQREWRKPAIDQHQEALKGVPNHSPVVSSQGAGPEGGAPGATRCAFCCRRRRCILGWGAWVAACSPQPRKAAGEERVVLL
jgi:hypothetical protein